MNRRKTKRTSTLTERDLDDIFIKELCYARMQIGIKEHLLRKDQAKRRAFIWVSSLSTTVYSNSTQVCMNVSLETELLCLGKNEATCGEGSVCKWRI